MEAVDACVTAAWSVSAGTVAFIETTAGKWAACLVISIPVWVVPLVQRLKATTYLSLAAAVTKVRLEKMHLIDVWVR